MAALPGRLAEAHTGRHPSALDRASGNRLAEAADRSDWSVLELGSGRSTPWLARRAGRVLSFEDNEFWHAATRSGSGGRIANVDSG
jgi:hypothetical protein